MAPDRRHPERSPATRGLAVGGWASAIATAAILVLVALDGRRRDWSGDPEAHHANVRRIADVSLPLSIAEWVGERVDPPPSAVQLLKPNVLANRRFRNASTGEAASVLVVQCGDARDLDGHYPPVCYPAHGLTLRSAVPRDWVVGGLRIPGTRYRFTDDRISSFSSTVVDNFVVLPDGAILRDMEGMLRLTKDRRLRVYGAAQVQVVTDGSMSDARRDEVLQKLLEPSLPLLAGLTAETNHE